MKIGIQTWGSEGDVRPFCALAGGLAKAGHNVTLAITTIDAANYRALSDELGFQLMEVGVLPYEKDEMARISGIIRNASNPPSQLRLILQYYFEPFIRDMYAASTLLCKENDAVVGHLLVHPLRAAADKSGRPYASVSLQPLIPSRYLKPAGMPFGGKWINPIWWGLVDRVIGRFVKPGMNGLRAREGLSPIGSVLREGWLSRELHLTGISPSLFNRPADWAEHIRICGFFNIPDSGEPWTMPDDLNRFIESGPPPVYMTFGSMIALEEGEPYVTETTRILFDAALKAGVRAIVQSRWGLVRGISEHPDVFRISRAPHQHVFPGCSMVVHHGGSGTTQTSIRFGLPSVVVEHMTDQLYWGTLLNGAGVAPRVLHRKRLTSDKLASAIRETVGSVEMKDKAREIGRTIWTEDGVGTAVKLIEQRFGG